MLNTVFTDAKVGLFECYTASYRILGPTFTTKHIETKCFNLHPSSQLFDMLCVPVKARVKGCKYRCK